MAQDRFENFLGVVGRLVVLVIIAVAMMILIGVLLKPALPMGLPMGDAGRILFSLMVGLSLVVAHLVVIVTMERSHWEVAGLSEEGWRPLTLLACLGLGVLVVGVPGGLLLLTGQMRVEPGVAESWLRFALTLLLPAAVFALAEEMFFRGYVLGILAQRWGAIAAITVTSLLFGAVHLVSASATPAGIASVVILGVFLGVLRLRTESLAAAWLAHLALNWMQVAVFHAKVPWLDPLAAPRYQVIAAGPAWLTGGALGVEGGVAAAIAAILLTALVLRVWRPPERSERSARR